MQQLALFITNTIPGISGLQYIHDYISKTQERYLIDIIDAQDWLLPLCEKLLEDKIFISLPDQVIINEYFPNQGISPHIDCIT